MLIHKTAKPNVIVVINVNIYPHLVKYDNQLIFLTLLKYPLKYTIRYQIVIKDNHIDVITCQTGFGTRKQNTKPIINIIHRIILFLTPLISIERNINSIKRIQNKTHETKNDFFRNKFRIKKEYVRRELIKKKKNLIFCLENTWYFILAFSTFWYHPLLESIIFSFIIIQTIRIKFL